MKKVMLLLMFGISIISCSDDADDKIKMEENVNISNQSKSLSELEGLKIEYANLLQTDAYIDASTSMKSFFQKIKMEGYYNIDTEDDLINWINSNPDSIEFSSPTEAINQYDIVKSKMANFYTINSSFFIKLTDLNNLERKEIVRAEVDLFIGTIEHPIQTTGCWGDCIDAANQCNRDAEQVYEEKLAAAILMASTGILAPAAAGLAANAYFERVVADKACAKGLRNCVDACD